jgi:hypothetical protein
MGACCTSSPTEAPEINSTNAKPSTATGGDFSAKTNDMEAAATKVQAYYRGVMTRRAIEEQYGFKAETMGGHKAATFTQSDAQVQEARRLVMQIRASLEPFKYDNQPADDSQVRITQKMVTLDNGAEYEG